MTTRIAVAAIGALFALLVLAFLLAGLWAWYWHTREPEGWSEPPEFHEGLDKGQK